MPRRHLFWILLAFAVSVTVRWPLIDRPLSAHHEYAMSQALTIIYNWYADGFWTHHGAPAISFSGPADLIPPGFSDSPGLRDGVLYYLSHPPLAFDLPFLLFRLTGSEPSVLGLQLFNLFFHLLTACGIYLITCTVVERGSSAPLISGLLYLFMPAPLWFHGNVYMSDMFVQNAWVWHVLVVLRMYARPRTGWRWPTLVALTLFLTTSISWPGVWSGAVLFFIALVRWWRSRDGFEWRVMLATLFGVGLALSWTTWRWLQVVDMQALWAYWTGRFSERGSIGNGASAWECLQQLMVNYRTGYLPVIAAVVIIWGLRRRTRAPGLLKNSLFLPISVLPVLLDHVLLLPYAVHDFAALKGGLLLCVLAGLGVASLRRPWHAIVTTVICLSGVLYFYRTNPLPGHDGGRCAAERNMGMTIAKEATKEETVLTLGFTLDPQSMWYAKRTFFRIDSLPQADEVLRAQMRTRGVVFSRNGDQLTAEHISLP